MGWRAYESALVEKLRHEFPPPAFEVRGMKVRGKHSRVPRQLDVAVFRKDVPHQLYLVADAKRYAKVLDVTHVEAFIGMLDDLDVRLGILAHPHRSSAGAQRRAAAANIQVHVVKYEEALKFHWLSVARSLYPSDPAFHPAMARALLALERGEQANFIDELEAVPFEEWDSVVGKAPQQLHTQMIEALTAIARMHPDDGWRYNAVKHLADTYGALSEDLIHELRQCEDDPETLELLGMLTARG